MPLPLASLNYLSITVVSHIPDLIYYFVKACVIMAPTVGYIDTLRLMIKSKNPAAFNMNIVLIMTSAHGLKVLYWFYHRFASHLLGQSIALLVVHFALVFFKFKYESQTQPASLINLPSHSRKKIKCPEIPSFKHVWNIKQTESFLEFMCSYILYYSFIYLIFRLSFLIVDRTRPIEIVGLISNLSESLVSMPNFIKVVIKGKIANISTVLIFQYIFGDLFKLFLFFLAHAPLPFFIGGFIQLSFDTILFITFMKLSKCGKNKNSDGIDIENAEDAQSLTNIETINKRDDKQTLFSEEEDKGEEEKK